MGVFKTKAPFGVATKRFSAIGFHPNLDHTGALSKKCAIGPGHYKVKDIRCIFVTKQRKETWTRKLELEEFSKTWGYKNMPLLFHRQEETKRGGPGHYDVSHNFLNKCDHNVYENFTFGKAKRFKSMIKNDHPGPGAYGVPKVKLEQKENPFHLWTNVPPFEWDGFRDRFAKLKRSWELPCNLYNTDVNGIASITKKVVSKKGPYNLFTGPRDQTTIKGYFAPPSFKGSKVGPRQLPHCFDHLLFSKSKARTGKFAKAERFPEKRITNTGKFYKLDRPRVFKQNLHPFNSSVAYPRPQKDNNLQPGVGRYAAKTVKCKIQVPERFQRTWQFKSVTGRTKYVAPEYNAF